MLLIVMLLNNFMSLQAQTNNGSPSTGSLLKADTTVATVPIYLIKQANAKMIERIYLIEINNQQDSIINDYKNLTKEQDIVIDDLQEKIIQVNKINEDVNKKYKKEHNKTIVFGSIAGCFAASTILFCLLNYLK